MSLWRGGFRSAAIGLPGWCNPFPGCGVWERIFLSPSGSPPGYFLRAMRRLRRIGIRLSIAMTGHRGEGATVERKLHGFRLYWAIYGAAAPPWRGRHGAHFAAPLVGRLRRIGIRLSIAMTGHRDALATMERELHGFRLYRAIYGAVAPPWRGCHGAHFAAPLGWAVAADRNPPFHRLRSRLGSVHDRVPWRPILWRGGFRSAAIGLLGWCNPFLGCGVWRASFCPSVASRLGVNHSGSPPGYFLCDQTVAADRNPPFHRLRGSQLYGLESAFP